MERFPFTFNETAQKKTHLLTSGGDLQTNAAPTFESVHVRREQYDCYESL